MTMLTLEFLGLVFLRTATNNRHISAKVANNAENDTKSTNLTVAFIDEDASESSFCAASLLRMPTNKLSKRAVQARWYKSVVYQKIVVSCCRIFKGQLGNRKLKRWWPKLFQFFSAKIKGFLKQKRQKV